MSYKVAWRVEIKKIIVLLGVFGFLFCVLEICFDISVYSIIKEKDLYRVIMGILLCYYVHDGKKAFQRLREDDFLDNIEKHRLCNDIKKEVEYWKEGEEEICEQLMLKFDVLKAMAPISLIPVIAGYFLEHSEEIELNLNVYIIIFVIILGSYFVTVIDTYAKLKDRKRMISKMKRKIIKIEDEENAKLGDS